MQSLQPRHVLILAAVFGFGLLIQSAAALEPMPATDPRWPHEDAVFVVSGWTVGPPSVEATGGNDYITRAYRSDGGQQATFAITTSSAAKRVYRAGADVPFLGGGYTVSPAPEELVPSTSQHGAFVAQRGDQRWLQIHAYGERRGLVGNGFLGWRLVVGDALMGQQNDYYLVRVMVPLGEVNAAREALGLADVLFPRVAAWYMS